MIHLKNKTEIACMQEAGKIVALVLEELRAKIKPGISTLELDDTASALISKHNGISSSLHYGNPPFPYSICTSRNYEVVHGMPNANIILVEGDIISIDVAVKLKGYHGDAARTFTVGAVSEDKKRLIEATELCFWEAFKLCQVDNRIGDISAKIFEVATKYGYGVVRELVGHGIGKNLHEDPDVPNFGKAGFGARIKPGLVIAVEPMINQGTHQIEILEDKWTIATLDRLASAHYENTIAITENGPIITTTLES